MHSSTSLVSVLIPDLCAFYSRTFATCTVNTSCILIYFSGEYDGHRVESRRRGRLIAVVGESCWTHGQTAVISSSRRSTCPNTHSPSRSVDAVAMAAAAAAADTGGSGKSGRLTWRHAGMSYSRCSEHVSHIVLALDTSARRDSTFFVLFSHYSTYFFFLALFVNLPVYPRTSLN